MKKIIDEENKIEFDIQKFLDEDCELTQKVCDKTMDRILNAESTSYDAGFKKALMMVEWYNKIFLGIDTEYDAEKIKRLYEKYKGK